MTSYRVDPFALPVEVCVCTFRRPQVEETLQGLAAMELPPGFRFRVIVADNDDTPSARELVTQTASRLALDVLYVHAPARNISVARNACLQAAQAPCVAFIDDDEIPAPGWLAALMEALADDVDVVLGPVQAVYADDCPPWLRRSAPHSSAPVWVDGEIRTGYTSNVLFRRTAASFRDLCFRQELGRSGGEDTAFFSAAHAAGARFAFSPTAVVTEIVPRERETFGWLFRRRFRAGQTHGRLLWESDPGVAGRVRILVTAAGKACLCLLAVAVPNRKAGYRRLCILRGALHLGVLARLLGKTEIEPYGHG